LGDRIRPRFAGQGLPKSAAAAFEPLSATVAADMPTSEPVAADMPTSEPVAADVPTPSAPATRKSLKSRRHCHERHHCERRHGNGKKREFAKHHYLHWFLVYWLKRLLDHVDHGWPTVFRAGLGRAGRGKRIFL
jgi:hypothetical protein